MLVSLFKTNKEVRPDKRTVSSMISGVTMLRIKYSIYYSII
jgi:hypothetical protein